MTAATHYSEVVEKWMPVLKKCKDVREEKYPLLAQALENQFVHHATASKILGDDDITSISDFTRFSLPVLRNTVPFLGISDLVGLQCAVNDLIVYETQGTRRVALCPFEIYHTFDKTLEEMGVDRGTPDAERKLSVQIGNGIIRRIDDFVVAELLREATKYDNLTGAIEGTGANWIMASREVVDHHHMFKDIVDKRGGHAFDEIYEGGYRSDIRPDGTLHGHQVYVHGSPSRPGRCLGDDKVLVGRYDGDESSGYILGLGALLLRADREADWHAVESGVRIRLMSSLSSHKRDMTKYGYVELT